MPDLSAFPIATRWPAQHPDRLQLYSLNTPNGVKVSILLEELGLPYEAHLVDIGKGESHLPEFLAANPNGKIPVLLDPTGPGGQPILLFESAAILLYLAGKAGKLMPQDARGRWEATQWLFFQMASVGPMFGQVGYFNKFAGKAVEDKRPLERYVGEAKRLLAILEDRLADRAWLLGADYSIVDIAHIGWVRNLVTFYEARDLVAFDTLSAVPRWLDAALARPAVQRGLEIPSRG